MIKEEIKYIKEFIIIPAMFFYKKRVWDLFAIDVKHYD